MERRKMLAALGGAALLNMQSAGESGGNAYLEVKTWRLHNSGESQGTRVSQFLQSGLFPSLTRAGAKPVGAFSNFIGPDGPYYVTVTQFASFASVQESLTKMGADDEYQHQLETLGAGAQFPFVRVESSFLRCFDKMPQAVIPPATAGSSHVFELRIYESPTPLTLSRKVGMFNGGEMQIFQRLGMRPIFFGETIIGPKQPNLMYMLSYDDLAARDRLWQAFSQDPEWKKLSGQPALKDSEIVNNIGNTMLRPLSFSPAR